MNVLLSGKFQWEKTDMDIMSRNGRDNIYICPNEEAPISLPHDEIDVVVCNWFFKYHKISDFTRLKYIQLLSAGYNGIIPNDAKKRGIVLHNAKDVYSIPISEFVMGNILMFYKNGYFFYCGKESHRWEKERNLQEIYNKKVLIVGTGSIGNEIGIRIRAFTDFVYGCNRTIKEDGVYRKVYPLQMLPDVVAEMDIVILTIALTDETTHLINEDVISKMKKSALIVNVSRGGVIDENALIVALKERIIGGAILDVFEQEPLAVNNPLWEMENTIITPHNAFVSDKNNERLREVIIRNYIAWSMSGE